MRPMKAALAALSLIPAVPALARERNEVPPELQLDPEELRVWELGSFRGGRLGVQVSSMTEELREAMGAPKSQGILVNRVLEDSAAKAAGIRPGDIIVEVEQEKIDSVGDVWKALAGKEGKVAIDVIRDRRRISLTARIDRPGRAPVFGLGDPALRREVDDLRARVKELEQRLEQLEKR